MRPCLGNDLEAGRAVLNSLQGPSLDAWLRDLLRPVALCGTRASLPALATLPLSAQANLLLLLRAAPHRFTGAQRAALLEGLAQLPAASGEDGDDSWGQQASLLQLLAAELGGDQSAAGATVAPPVPPCPDFLYTSQPCFPWAPVLVDPATASALHKQQAAASKQQQQQGRPGVRQQEPLGQLAAAGGKRAPGEEQAAQASPAKQQRVGVAAGAGAPAAAAAQLPTPAGGPDADLGAAAGAVRAALDAAAAAGGSTALAEALPQLRDALDLLLSYAAAGSPEGGAAWEAAGLGAIQDDSLLLLLLSDLVTPSSSFARCSAAVAGLLLPRLRALDGPAPRGLAAAVEHAGAANPQAYIAACLRPLLSSPGLSKHLAELVSGTLKSALPPQLLPEVVAAACAPVAATPAAAAGGTAWNEHTVMVLQAVLNAKPALSAPGVAQLAAAAAAAVLAPAGGAELAPSPKFAKLLLSVAKQYPAESAAAKAQLQAAAQHTKSFMTKSLLATLSKL